MFPFYNFEYGLKFLAVFVFFLFKIESLVYIFDFLLAYLNDITYHVCVNNSVSRKFCNFQSIERIDKRIARTDNTVVFN